MNQAGFVTRVRAGVLTGAVVIGIVLASLVGLDGWADAAATHGVSATADGGQTAHPAL